LLVMGSVNLPVFLAATADVLRGRLARTVRRLADQDA